MAAASGAGWLTARAEARIPVEALARGKFSGSEVATSIFEAWAFAAADPYRAATHNKGIMNGIDAVVIATGNDWRAVEAGAHAYAARNGSYASMTDWHVDENGDLYGEITLPMVVGMLRGHGLIPVGVRGASGEQRAQAVALELAIMPAGRVTSVSASDSTVLSSSSSSTWRLGSAASAPTARTRARSSSTT